MPKIRTTLKFSSVPGATKYGVKWAMALPDAEGNVGKMTEQPEFSFDVDPKFASDEIGFDMPPVPAGAVVGLLIAGAVDGVFGRGRQFQFIAAEGPAKLPAPASIREAAHTVVTDEAVAPVPHTAETAPKLTVHNPDACEGCADGGCQAQAPTAAAAQP